MVYLVSIIHMLTCIFVVIFILLQDPKGGVLGALGGGGSKSFFGAGGTSQFLVTVTKWMAISFACSSFYLSYMGSKQDSGLMSTTSPIEKQENTDSPAKKPTDSPTQKPVKTNKK